MSHQQTDPIITRAFHDRESAERACDAIAARGYRSDEIHVIMSDETRKKMFDGEHSDDKGNKALKGAGVGGAVGGAIGATLVAIATSAAAITVPGVGLLIAGPLAGALAGGAAGATTGGLVGMLVGAGIPEDRAKLYEEDLKKGGIVVGVRPRNDVDARYFDSDWQGL